MVVIFIPIGALNNVDSGAFTWLVGLGSFLYFCSYYMKADLCGIVLRQVLSYNFLHFLRSPRFIRNYSSVSNPAAEYTAVFVINILMLLFFALVFAFESFCALRRRVVAFQRGESEAMQLHPRWFSTYRY